MQNIQISCDINIQEQSKGLCHEKRENPYLNPDTV